ncbi:D123 cell division cycle protein [Nitzschia inconspicua]|uniref:D123 cell division cycle protein n=1 Tax=Nitzschia inconspicua TaxID=303405 RepID=A0A9K3Q3S8_9STRA|nr:D123 cell division cycle protein [Nitzschia inconspicua]
MSSNISSPLEQEGEYAGPIPSVKEVLACQFSSWYNTFAAIRPLDNACIDDDVISNPPLTRKNVTLPSVIIHDLPLKFSEYLLSDGVQLPLNTRTSSCVDMHFKRTEFDDDSDDDDWERNKEHEPEMDKDHPNQEHDGDQQPQFDFPELNQQIASLLKEPPFSAVGGAALPKLNWSAPKDATWINGGSLKCTTPGDVYLLLKASDFCLHDILYKTLKESRDYLEVGESPSQLPPLQLVLRKWCNLHPSMEFRCFVRHHDLIAISQRHHSQHYPHLKKDWESIRNKLDDFFEEYIRYRFANGQVPNYVVDVYLDQKDRVWIIDFNCWSFTTDTLLFEWTELVTKDQASIEEEPVEMRIVETEQQVRHDPLSSYRAPIDTVDLATMTRGDAKQFEEFMKLCQRPSDGKDWSDSDNDDLEA